jgi:hypothetical protein
MSSRVSGPTQCLPGPGGPQRPSAPRFPHTRSLLSAFPNIAYGQQNPFLYRGMIQKAVAPLEDMKGLVPPDRSIMG